MPKGPRRGLAGFGKQSVRFAQVITYLAGHWGLSNIDYSLGHYSLGNKRPSGKWAHFRFVKQGLGIQSASEALPLTIHSFRRSVPVRLMIPLCGEYRFNHRHFKHKVFSMFFKLQRRTRDTRMPNGGGVESIGSSLKVATRRATG